MTTLAVTDVTQSEHSTVSWGAVIAGGIAAAALSLFLLALGVGLGLSSISPWSGQGVSATTFRIGAGVYLVCVAMLSSTVGGYLAGRLRIRDHIPGPETMFRDAAHGFMAWVIGVGLMSLVLLWGMHVETHTTTTMTDEARKAASYVSFWSFLALLFGAVAATLAGMLGGELRDEV